MSDHNEMPSLCPSRHSPSLAPGASDRTAFGAVQVSIPEGDSRRERGNRPDKKSSELGWGGFWNHGRKL